MNIKNLLNVSLLVLLLAAFSGNTYAGNPMKKQLKKEYKKKMKQLKKEDWELSGSSRTLEVKLLQHYEMLNDDNNQELIAVVTQCNSLNVCQQVALNNALTKYASTAGSYVKGRITSEQQNVQNSSEDLAEFDNFYAAYERLVNKEVKNVIKESFAIIRESGDNKEYQVFYIVNEDEAAKARMAAMRRAAEESKLAQENARRISDFVNEGFEIAD